MDSQQKGQKRPLPKNAEKYAMDYGISNISKLSSGGAQRMKLPTSISVDPCEGKIEEKLKRVLEFKTLGKTMFQLLSPIITDRSVISPQNFRLKIRQVCDVFASEIEKGGEFFLCKELFEDVISLLKTEEDKCELLDQYRHMLLMG